MRGTTKSSIHSFVFSPSSASSGFMPWNCAGRSIGRFSPRSSRSGVTLTVSAKTFSNGANICQSAVCQRGDNAVHPSQACSIRFWDNRSHLQMFLALLTRNDPMTMLCNRWWWSCEADDNAVKPKITYREIDDNVFRNEIHVLIPSQSPPPHFNHTTNRDNVMKPMTMLWNRSLHIMKSIKK